MPGAQEGPRSRPPRPSAGAGLCREGGTGPAEPPQHGRGNAVRFLSRLPWPRLLPWPCECLSTFQPVAPKAAGQRPPRRRGGLRPLSLTVEPVQLRCFHTSGKTWSPSFEAGRCPALPGPCTERTTGRPGGSKPPQAQECTPPFFRCRNSDQLSAQTGRSAGAVGAARPLAFFPSPLPPLPPIDGQSEEPYRNARTQ